MYVSIRTNGTGEELRARKKSINFWKIGSRWKVVNDLLEKKEKKKKMTNNALKGLGGREEQPAGIKAICTAEPWSSSGAKKGEHWGS